MKHFISSRTALCLCGLTLCFNASAQGYDRTSFCLRTHITSKYSDYILNIKTFC